jgi:hypothetical protein
VLVRSDATDEALCPLIVLKYRSTLGVFRDGIEEGVHIVRSVHINTELFYNDLRDAMKPRIDEFQRLTESRIWPAVLVMNDRSAHTSFDGIALLSRQRVKAITFPITHIWNSLDVGPRGFRRFKHIKEHLSRNSSVPVMEAHAVRMFKGY